jgi:alkanesulfonate monooxygenase SsuD/methylene tetrahydromethanopterin reductase-like flavin-dependent oxidoreductase (luciferase family)
MVTNPVSRDPIVLASAFATLQDLTGGRMLCGIGRGDSAVRVLKRRPATVAATEHAATVVRMLGSGEPMDVDGVQAQIKWAPRKPLPVYVAAYGPRMLEVAGRVGDGVIIECVDQHYISWALEHVRRGAESAGRDATKLDVVCSTAAFVGSDLARARDEVRPLGSVVGNHVAEVLRNSGPDSMPKELATMIENRPEYDYLQHVHKGAGHSNYVPDDIIDRLCLIGTVEACVEKLVKLRELGVTHVNLYAQSGEFEAQAEAMASAVIPRVREGAQVR